MLKNFLKIYLISGIIGAIIIFGLVLVTNAVICLPSNGCTGIGIATSSNEGQYLKVNKATSSYNWSYTFDTPTSTSLFGLTGNINLTTSTANNNWSIATSSGIIFNFPYNLEQIRSLATTTGNVLVATGLPTAWSLISTSSLGLVNSINGLIGTITGLNIYNSTTSINGLVGAITGLNIYNTTTTIGSLSGTITLGGSLKTIGNAIDTIQPLSSTSSVAFANVSISSTVTSTNLSFQDGTYSSTSERCDMSFMIENPTSTNSLDLNGDSFPVPFPFNAIITKIKAWNTQVGQTAGINLSYSSSTLSATSTYAVFSATQTITSNTSTIITSFTSSTPNANDILRLNFAPNTASTSQIIVNTCYKQR